MKYEVIERVVSYVCRVVEANSKDEAIGMIEDGHGEIVFTEEYEWDLTEVREV